MNNSTLDTEIQAPRNSGVLAGAVAFATLVVNIFFFIVGLKTLKKKAHNMLVLSMCVGDCLYGGSVFSLVFVNRSSPTVFIPMCKGQLLLLFLSIAMSLTMALMICVERFVTVRHFNFGSLAKSDGWKKKMSIASVTLTTAYVTVCLTAIPSQENPPFMCKPQVLYAPHLYQLMMGLLSGLYLILMLSIIIVYSKVVCMLFSYLKAKSQISPFDRNNTQCNRSPEKPTETDSSNESSYDTTRYIDCSCSSKNESLHMYNLNKTPMEDIESSKHRNSCFSLEKGSERVSTSGIEVITLSPKQSSSQPHAKNNEDKAGTRKSPNKTDQWTEWEHKALATSSYIIGSTVLLNGPLISCLVCDAFGLNVPSTIGDITAMLVALQCVVNPFIYAFRFGELRKAIKNIICCKKSSV